jgi:uncharacterized protein
MALAGFAPAAMKPTALVLNILVAGLGSFRYIRSKCFNGRAFWPFALGAAPFAFLGGATATSDSMYRSSLGVLLVLAACALLLPRQDTEDTRPAPLALALIIGMGIGYVSGLIGVGGGIFLSPILILLRWTKTREALGVSALFIVVNSVAGLAGHLASIREIPFGVAVLALAAFLGAVVGTELGSRTLPPPWIRGALAAVLIIAASKLLLT